MHYVKQFKINGVDTRQVACIELRGAPNAATEGSLGALGIDVTSPTHEVYKCVAVNGSVYTWELLSGGMSIMSANITGEGAMSMAFPYTNIIAPNNYIYKSGDLILDSEGYLYQIETIGATECYTTYCGTHIGGIASGDKDCRLVIENGKLQLVTESGKVLSEVDCLKPDGDTIYRNGKTGEISAIGVKTVGGRDLRLFVGTKAEYDALTPSQKQNLFAIITDDNNKQEIWDAIDNLNHLYYHTLRVKVPMYDMSSGSPVSSGLMYLIFRITSPNPIFDKVDDLIHSPEMARMYYEGKLTLNGTAYEVLQYINTGFDDEGYDRINIKTTNNNDLIINIGEPTADISTVQLY